MSLTRKISLIIVMLYFVVLGTERFNLIPSFMDNNNLFYKVVVLLVAYVSCLTLLYTESRDPRFKLPFLTLFWVLIGFAILTCVMVLKFNGVEEFGRYVTNFADGFTFYTFAFTILITVIKKEK
ncbi:hypothetical protein ABEP16_12280 [Priestia aryabhattai]|uniref:hypothetical protein n=1 Tax=Priestia aryabhattai TaxID=412384 RepID=UPI003D2D3825